MTFKKRRMLVTFCTPILVLGFSAVPSMQQNVSFATATSNPLTGQPPNFVTPGERNVSLESLSKDSFFVARREGQTEEWLSADDLYSRGVQLLTARDNLGALTYFEKAVSRDHDHSKAWFKIGLLRLELGVPLLVIEAFKEVARIEPDHAMAHYYLGIAYLTAEDKKSAWGEYTILQTLSPDLAGKLRREQGWQDKLQTGKVEEPETKEEIPHLFNRVKRSVVTIVGRANNFFGSGFLVKDGGYVITNYHVVEGQKQVTVIFPDKRRMLGDVVKIAEGRDLALVRLQQAAPRGAALKLASSASVQVGETVIAIGAPYGLALSVTNGIVSSVRILEGMRLIQTNAAINPGNSGGPLINLRGEVVGVNTLKLKYAEGIGFAVAVDHVKELLDER
jgi:hypothetical protein